MDKKALRAMIRHQKQAMTPAQIEAKSAALGKLLPSDRKILPLKKDGTPNAYSLFNAARTCGKLTLKKARRDLQACATADRQLVSTQLDDRDILHKLVVTLTA